VSWLVLAALILAVACLAVSAALLVARSRKRRVPLQLPRREATLRHPIVLAHGVLGFDHIEVAGRRHVYFRGVPERLRSIGIEVHRPPVPPVASVAARAEQLAAAVRALPAAKVNLIAHSMGGLDARYAIARLGLADRVVSLTTIGTPHRGSPLADVGISLLTLCRRLFRTLDLEVLHDLTSRRMTAFNLEIPDAPTVAYASVVAWGDRAAMNPLLWASHLYGCAGPNDGVVPASSQSWGEVLRQIEADHWAQIGWSSAFDAPALYEDLARELRGRGF
jgi:triacylglycerol lipase